MSVEATMPNTLVSAPGTGSSASSSNTSSTATSGIADNFQTFLTLLTTQLQHQNPLDPLDTNQFTAQLVQFAGVEQQMKMNQQMTSLISIEQSAQSTAAMAYLGSTATVDLSKDVERQAGGTFGENGMFKSLVYTVTAVPGIASVKITIGGATLPTLPGGHLELDEPLHRSDF